MEFWATHVVFDQEKGVRVPAGLGWHCHRARVSRLGVDAVWAREW
jgi:hypothetical protein